MITQADVRARTRVVRAHSRLRQDDCGGSALMMRKVTLVTAVMKAGKGNPGLEGGGSGTGLRAQLGRGKESEVAF